MFDVVLLDAETAPALLRFAAQAPLVRGDFASIAANMPAQTKVWLARDRSGEVHAAAIDDGLAIAVSGDAPALDALSVTIPGIAQKLVVSGRLPECRAFMTRYAEGRRERPETFMAVDAEHLAPGGPLADVDLRIAGPEDLPMLEEARTQALEEEYGIELDRSGPMVAELRSAVARAVSMLGVAIWVLDGKIAFTAQLISKTPVAAMFGDLYTDPQLRGAGRATAGLSAFCRWLMTESTNVTLRVGNENLPALKLYERVGFSRVDDYLSSLGDSR